MSLRVLFLTHEPPLPLVSGARLRSYHLMRELAARGCRVSLFALASDGPVLPADERELAELCERVQLWPFAPRQMRRRARLAADYVLSRPFQKRYFYSASGARAVAQLVAELRPDVAVVGQLYMVPYLPCDMERLSIFDSHNVEARRIATMTRAPGPRGVAARRQARPVASHEAGVVARFGRVWAVSEEERRHFEALSPGRVDLVPNGVDLDNPPLRWAAGSGTDILFLGRMDYGPNVDAARSLIEDVLPHLERRDSVLKIVGANPPAVLRNLARDSAVPVEVTGFVSDTGPHWQSARMLVVYLRAAGGTRLKILEALARGVPVVTTTLGCEGLGLQHGRDVLIADDPVHFAHHIDALLADVDLCQVLSRHGRRTVVRFNWSSIGDAAERSLKRLVSSRPRQNVTRG